MNPDIHQIEKDYFVPMGDVTSVMTIGIDRILRDFREAFAPIAQPDAPSNPTLPVINFT